MLEVKVVLVSGGWSYFSHVAVSITDMASTNTPKDFLVISYDRPKGEIESDQKLQKAALENINPTCCGDDSVTLYSNCDFKTFKEEYIRKFNPEKYNCCCFNCADAVEFALEKLFPFPVPCSQKAVSISYKALCCVGFFATLGNNGFPSIFCTTPSDAYKKAQMLSLSYGDPEKIPLLTSSVVQNKPSPPSVSR